MFHNQHYCQVMSLDCKSGIQILLVQWAYTNEVISVIYLNGSMPAKKRWKGDHLSDNIQSQTGKTLEQGKPEPKQNKISCMMNCLHNLVNNVPPFLFVQHHHNRLIAKTNAKYKKQEKRTKKCLGGFYYWDRLTTCKHSPNSVHCTATTKSSQRCAKKNSNTNAQKDPRLM